MRKRGIRRGKRLLLIILVAFLLFFTLVFLEDYVRAFIKSIEKRRVIAQERNAIKRAVEKYNEILIKAYKRPNPDLMEKITTDEEQKRVGLYIMFMLGKNQVLHARLDKLEFNEVKIERKNRAIAKTTEDWTYKYLDFKTRKTVAPAKKIHYEVTYTLEKKKEAWLVSSVSFKE